MTTPLRHNCLQGLMIERSFSIGHSALEFKLCYFKIQNHLLLEYKIIFKAYNDFAKKVMGFFSF